MADPSLRPSSFRWPLSLPLLYSQPPEQPPQEKLVSIADLAYMHEDPAPSSTHVSSPLSSTPESPPDGLQPSLISRQSHLSNVSPPTSSPSTPSSSALATAGLTPALDTNGSILGGPHPADFPFPQYHHLAAIGEGTPSDLNGEVPLASTAYHDLVVPPPPSNIPFQTAPIGRVKENASSSYFDRKPERVNNGPPPVSQNAELLGRRGRSQSSGSKTSNADGSTTKPTMLSAIGGQKSANFLRNIFHKEDKGASSGSSRVASKERSRSSTGRSPGGDPLSLDVSRQQHSPNPNEHSPYSNPSPPMTPGSPYNGNESAVSSVAPSRAPSRATSVKRPTGSNGAGSYDGHSNGHVNPNLLADKLAAASLHKNGSAASPSGPLSPSVGHEDKHKFNLKDLLNSGPKLVRRPSASSAASKSERALAKSDKGGSEKGGEGVSTASLLTKYGVCEKAAIGKGATAVVRLAHKWDRREEKLYAVKVRFVPCEGGW